jgi:hypothetical protein
VEERPAAWLHRHGHRSAPEPLAQTGGPLGQGFRGVLGAVAAGGAEADRMLLIGPVNADEGRERHRRLGCSWRASLFDTAFRLNSREPKPGEIFMGKNGLWRSASGVFVIEPRR